MHLSVSHRPDPKARLSFWLLVVFLVILWIAGGASRADVMGQPVVRFFAWTFLIVVVLFFVRFEWQRITPLAVVLGLTILLVTLQLVPLPPAAWSSLPGRELLLRAAVVADQPQPWRPLSISPSATANALGSLVVPVAVLGLSAHLTREQHWRITEIVLALILAACFLALLQFSGARIENPFINDQAGAVSGNFANRNHFALFVALGCLIAPAWGLRTNQRRRWKPIVAMALLPFFLLVILATGSRTGLVLGGLAIIAGLLVVRTKAMRELQSLPRGAAIGIAGFLFVALISAVMLSYAFGRAIAVDRILDLDTAGDLRSQALPYVIEAIVNYFPVGSGFGTFDPVYRIGEPDVLLQPVYFNHAHNDWLEISLGGGIAGVVLILIVLWWTFSATLRIWRHPQNGLARVGAVALLLIMIASITDYPARTPMIMAMSILAALWLHMGINASHESSSAVRDEP